MKKRPDNAEISYMGMPGYIPPQAIEVEMTVLGELIANAGLMAEVRPILRPDSFYKDSHQIIYSSLISIEDSGRVADVLLLTEYLRKGKLLEDAGGPHYLSELMGRAIGGFNIVQHSLIIAERHLERRMIALGGEVQKAVYTGSSDTLELIEKAREAFMDMDAAGLIRGKRISCNMEVDKHKDLLSLNGVRILSIGGISTLVAPPGSGKSQICEAICAVGINPECDGFGFQVHGVPNDGGVLYIDTERSWNDAIAGIHRIKMRVDVKKNSGILGNDGMLRGLVYESFVAISSVQQRRSLLEGLIRKGNNGRPYRLVIVDGIGDLCEDVNDVKESPGLIGWLTSICNRYKTGIFMTIHDNPANNKNKARGTLGSELGRKSESMMLLKRAPDDKNVRMITMDFEYGKNRNARDTSLDSFISWSEDQKMMVRVDHEMAQKAGDGMGYKQIIDEIFKNVRVMKWADLSQKYQLMTGKKEKTAQRHINECVEMGLLEKDDKTKTYRIAGDLPF